MKPLRLSDFSQINRRWLAFLWVMVLLMVLIIGSYTIFSIWSGSWRLSQILGLFVILLLLTNMGMLQRIYTDSSVMIKARELELQRISQNVDEWVWRIQPDTVINHSNEVIENLLGYSAEEIIGVKGELLMHPDDRAIAEMQLGLNVERQSGWEPMLMRWRHKDGSWKWLESNALPIMDPKGELLGFSGASRDKTLQQRQLERERQRAAQEDIKVKQIKDILTHPEYLEIVFQPIYDLQTMTAVGYEALSRFNIEPKQSPDKWFALAENIGLGVRLEIYAIEKALKEFDFSSGAYLSLNVSPQTLQSGSFLTLLDTTNAPRHLLVVEITEHEAVEDYTLVKRVLARIRNLGIRVAVDDTGAGFASFKHILQLEPDIIKLDLSITRDIDSNRGNEALAMAIVSFAQKMGVVITAEGIETNKELETLMKIQVSHGQGYLLGRPSRLLVIAHA